MHRQCSPISRPSSPTSSPCSPTLHPCSLTIRPWSLSLLLRAVRRAIHPSVSSSVSPCVRPYLGLPLGRNTAITAPIVFFLPRSSSTSAWSLRCFARVERGFLLSFSACGVSFSSFSFYNLICAGTTAACSHCLSILMLLSFSVYLFKCLSE